MDENKSVPERMNDLYKLLAVDRITTYRPAKEDPDDLKSEAVTGAYEFFAKRGESVVVKKQPGLPMPLLPPKLGLAPRDPPPWDLWFRYQLDAYIEALALDYLSLFFGGMDRTKEASRQRRRNHFEKWEAQKRSGRDVDLEEADRTSVTRSSSGVWKKRSERLNAEDTQDASQAMFDVLTEAGKHKRWGPQSIEFAKYFLQGKSEKEAASLAGITDRTARNHLAALRKIFKSRK